MFGVAGAYQDFGTTAGESFEGSVWALNDGADVMAGGQVAAVNIEWLDATSTNIGTEFGTTLLSTDPMDVWTMLTVSGTAPAGTVFARLVVITGDFAGPGGGAPRFDDAYFSRSVVPIPGALLMFAPALLGLMDLRRKSA